ncbi:radical SAM protein [Chloroflexota bacterium]
MLDSNIDDMSYHDFGLLLSEKTKNNRFPYMGTIEITPKCNLRCVHCYISQVNFGESILTYEEWCKIFDEIAEENCLWLLITGGEPLLRPDFIDIYTYMKKRGFLISLFTNGTLITEEIADYFYEWRPKMVEISLYGATKQTYEKVTGVPGSFNRCIEGINLLLERKIPLHLKTVAITANIEEIKSIKEYADDLGVPFRFDPHILPRLDHGVEPTRFRLTPKQVVELEQEFPERISDLQEFCDTHVRQYLGDSLFICGASGNSFFIDPFGKLSPCLLTRNYYYDLRQIGFKEGWQNSIREISNLKATEFNECRNCRLISVCGCCPGWAELETGDPNGKSEWLCEVTHMKMSLVDIKKFLS